MIDLFEFLTIGRLSVEDDHEILDLILNSRLGPDPFGIDTLIGWRPDDSGFDLIGIDSSTVSRIP